MYYLINDYLQIGTRYKFNIKQYIKHKTHTLVEYDLNDDRI